LHGRLPDVGIARRPCGLIYRESAGAARARRL
jgi:hypothetical protein